MNGNWRQHKIMENNGKDLHLKLETAEGNDGQWEREYNIIGEEQKRRKL